jgi:hypothetical protein
MEIYEQPFQQKTEREKPQSTVYWKDLNQESIEGAIPQKIEREKLQSSVYGENLNQQLVKGAEPSLDDAYVYEDRKTVLAFVNEHHLRGPLTQAIKPLNECFGERLKVLTLASDDEGAESLFCLVKWRDNLQDARTALRTFDQQWWLAKCAQIGGKLNFDFDLV